MEAAHGKGQEESSEDAERLMPHYNGDLFIH